MESFAKEWFANPQWWFDCPASIDEYLTKTYGNLIGQKAAADDNPVHVILCLDQLPRHVLRNQPCAHILSYYCQKAIHVYNQLSRDYIESLPDEQWCFVLLPLRHSQRLDLIFEAMKLAWERLHIDPTSILVKRFLKAAYQRCPTYDQHDQVIKYDPVGQLHFSKDILDDTNTEPPVNKLPATLPQYSNSTLLSLSGGVDSMVCSVIGKPYLAAVHINYCNRPTAMEEEEFVRAWCSANNILLYVRRISEIKRKECMENEMREVYETYTRNVRYGTYKTVANIFGVDPHVVLGHNKDDCLENIFTNIAHKNHLENLQGMSEVSQQDGITFFRPLLSYTKRQIKCCAKALNIPHLPNSTPAWSQRGKIRANIVPVMDAWNPCFIDGLYNMVSTLTSLHKILDRTTDVLANALLEDRRAILDNVYEESEYWREVIYKVHAVRPSVKALQNLKDRLAKFTNNTESQSCRVVVCKGICLQFKKLKGNKIEMTMN